MEKERRKDGKRKEREGWEKKRNEWVKKRKEREKESNKRDGKRREKRSLNHYNILENSKSSPPSLCFFPNWLFHIKFGVFAIVSLLSLSNFLTN